MVPLAAPPRAVFFDMDDTIFDHWATREVALANLREEVPVLREHPLTVVTRRYDELLDSIYPNVLSGILTHAQARELRFQRLLEGFGAPVSMERAREYSDTYRAHYQVARRPVPGAPDSVRHLRGKVILGIVSNNHQEEQLDKLRAIGLEGVFDFVLTSELAGAAKPDPAIFRMALRQADCQPGESVMVGDNWAADIIGARGSGIPPVWFNRFGQSPPEATRPVELRSFDPAPQALTEVVFPRKPEPA
ncbi:MAG: HAD family hydrolase [Thermoplasmata archaeon]|nr:HAD family hydrolase [Thermoplasmata archaeon]